MDARRGGGVEGLAPHTVTPCRDRPAAIDSSPAESAVLVGESDKENRRSSGKRRGRGARSLRAPLLPKALIFAPPLRGCAAVMPSEGGGTGLAAGEVVALSVGGRMLVAQPTAANAKVVEFGPTGAARGAGPEALLDPACQLTVQRAGEWVGFKLGGRMLQAKRKGSSRFAFFSPHFGVAEQWTLSPEPATGEWSRQAVVLRNRRLESIELHCEMIRVPLALRAANSRHRPSPTPSSPTAPSSLRAESIVGVPPCTPTTTVCAAPTPAGGGIPSMMNGIMVRKWSDFVTREIAARQTLEKDVSMLMSTMAQIREDTAQQVHQARSEAASSIEEAVRASKLRQAELAARQASKRRLHVVVGRWRQWAVCRAAESRRRDQLVAKQLARAASDRALFTLREWAEVAARKSFQRRQVEDFRQLIQDGFLLRLFVGWCAWAMLRSQKRSLVAWSRTQQEHRLRRAHFIAWRQVSTVFLRSPARYGVLSAHRRSPAAAARSARMAVEIAVSHFRAQARFGALHCAFSGWRRHAGLRRELAEFAAFRRWGRVQGSFTCWREELLAARLRRQVATATAAERVTRVAWLAFVHWRESAAMRAALRSAVEASQQLRSRRQRAASFRAWAGLAAVAVVQRSRLARFKRHLVLVLTTRSLQEWRRVVSETVEERRRVEAFRGRVARHALSTTFDCWADAAGVGAAWGATVVSALAQHANRVRRMLVASRIAAWRQAVVDSAGRTAVLCGMLAASVSRAERALLLDCVVGWREYVGEVRRQSALLEVHSARLLAFNTQCILDEWLHTAHRLRHQRRLVHDLRHLFSIRRLRCIFEIWRTEAGGIHGSEFLAREAVGHAHERFVSSRIKRRALFAWFALAISKRRTLQAFLQVRPATRAFEAWRARHREQKKRRELVDSALGRLNARLVLCSLQTWYSYAMDRRVVRAAAWDAWMGYRHAKAHKRHRHSQAEVWADCTVLRRAVKGWRAVVARKSAQRAFVEVVIAQMEAFRLWQVLAAWSDRAAEAATHRHHTAIARAMAKSRLMLSVWLEWLWCVNARLHRHEVARDMCARHSAALLRRALAAFRANALISRATSELETLARFRMARGLKLRILTAWRWHAELMSELTEAAKERSASRRVAAAFATLRAAAISGAETCRVADERGVRSQWRHASRLLSHWSTLAGQRRRLLALLIGRSRRVGLTALLGWASWARHAAACSARVSTLQRRWSTAKVFAAFFYWRSATEQKIAGVQVVEAKRRRWARSTAVECLTAWRRHTHSLRTLRAAVVQGSRIAEVSTQRRALDAWRLASYASRCIQRRIASFLRRCDRRCVAFSLRGWHVVVHRHAAVATMIARSALRLETSTLRAWSTAVARRVVARSLIRRHSARRSATVLRGAFSSWAAITRRGVSVSAATRLAGAVATRWTLRSVFVVWCLNVCASVETRVRALTVLPVKMERRVLSFSFRDWAALSAMLLQRRAVAGKLAELRQRLVLSRALFHWRRTTQQAVEARSAIRRNVNSRRVAKDWFLGWYSNAFEQEIQQAMEALYGACDDYTLDASFDFTGGFDSAPPSAVHSKPSPVAPIEHPARFLEAQKPSLPEASAVTFHVPASLAFDMSASFSSSNDDEPVAPGVVVEWSTVVDVAANTAAPAAAAATMTPNQVGVAGAVHDTPLSEVSMRTPLIFAFDPEEEASARKTAGFTCTNPMYGNPLYANRGEKECPSPMALVMPSPHPGYQPTSALRPQRRALTNCENSVDSRVRSGGSKLRPPTSTRKSGRATPVRTNAMSNLMTVPAPPMLASNSLFEDNKENAAPGVA